MATISVSKLVPGQQYTVDGELLTYVGTRFSGSQRMDKNPVPFSYAAFGDRWVFTNSTGKEVEFKKGFNSANKAGLTPAMIPLAQRQTVKIVA